MDNNNLSNGQDEYFKFSAMNYTFHIYRAINWDLLHNGYMSS